MASGWGQARFEITSLRREILARLDSGLTVRALYDDLKSSSRIGMSERSFYDRVKRLRSQPTALVSSTPLSSAASRRPLPLTDKPSALPSLPVTAGGGLGRLDFDAGGRPLEELWAGEGSVTDRGLAAPLTAAPPPCGGDQEEPAPRPMEGTIR